MKNLYRKYWIEKPKKVHGYKMGVYHVSQIGNSHADLQPGEHSGPCLRQGYWDYIDSIEFEDGTVGNFHIGNILHEDIQRIAKLNNPAVVNEFPLRVWLAEFIISGSVDNIVFVENGIHIVDFKTASQYTLPKGSYDKNITHFTQVYIYAFLLSKIFKLDILDVSVVYINKHNLATYKQTEKYKVGKAIGIYTDFLDRCGYLHSCLKAREVPIAEPMKWCKYCRYKEKCIEVEDSGS